MNVVVDGINVRAEPVSLDDFTADELVLWMKGMGQDPKWKLYSEVVAEV
jgi:hypothetical protein